MSATNSPSHSNRIDLLLLFASRISRSFAAGAIAVAVPLYFVDVLQLSLLMTGILLASGAFASPILSFVFGFLGDRYGRKKTLLFGLVLLPFAVLILLTTTFYPLILLATALGGFGVAGGLVGGGVGAFVAPMQTALLAEKSNKNNRTTIYTAFTMSSNFAGSIGALVLAFLTNYTDLFYFSLIFTILSVLFIIPLHETFKPEPVKKKFSGNITGRDKDIIRKFVITGIFNGLTQGLVTPFLVIILQQNFLLTEPQIGTVIAVGGILTTSIMAFTPYLTKKLGFVNYIIISRVISAIFVLFFPFSPSAFIAVISYWIFTITRAIALPSQMALMMNLISDRARAQASGTNQAARLLPLATSTTFSGELLAVLPLSFTFGLAFVLSLFNVFFYHRFFGNIDEEEKAHQASVAPS